jgi:hypothetical protein
MSVPTTHQVSTPPKNGEKVTINKKRGVFANLFPRLCCERSVLGILTCQNIIRYRLLLPEQNMH